MKEINPAQKFELEKMKSFDPKMQIRWDRGKKAPVLLKGKLAEPFPGPVAKLAIAAALNFLEDKRHLFRMNAPKEEFTAIQKTEDSKGNLYVVLQQKHKNIPVDGATVRVHFSPSKTVYQVTNKYEAALEVDHVWS